MLVSGCSCPCQGPLNSTAQISFPVPLDAPPGATINGQGVAVDQYDQQFFCVDITFKIGSPNVDWMNENANNRNYFTLNDT